MNHEPECDELHRLTCSCTCEEIRAAYRRGREDAANAVGLLGTWLDETVDFGDAIAAARGDVPCEHNRTQYTREVCWCGDAVDVCENCGEDVHDCAALKDGKPT